MNIYKQELKMIIKSVIIWSIAIAVLIFVYLSLFSSFSGEAKLVNEMMANFPEEFLIAFGMANMDLATILGFFGVIFFFVQMCLSIQAANYGFSLVSVEERELTADFLLTRPVRREKILTSKLLAALTGLGITAIVVWISSYVFVTIFSGEEGFDLKPLILLLLSIPIFQTFFLTVGLLISLLVKRIRSVLSFSMSLAFGMYVLNAFGGMIGDEKMEIISPFNHFDPNYIIKNSAYDLPLVSISVVAIIVSVVGSYVLYSKRNIPSVA